MDDDEVLLVYPPEDQRSVIDLTAEKVAQKGK